MTSAIGDVLKNPLTNGSNPKEASGLAYAMQGFNRGLASLPDMALNALSLGGKGIGKNPIESLFKKLGILNDLPEAKSNINKLAEGLGGAAGGMVIPGGAAVRGLSQGAGTLNKGIAQALLGTQGPIKNAGQLANKTFASTIGGAAAQGSAQPSIESITGGNPYLSLPLSMGAGLAGGGIASTMGRNPQKMLPNQTAAQRLFQEGKLNEPLTKSLERKQLELVESNPKAAEMLQKISEGQENQIYQKIPKSGNVEPHDIADRIKNFIDDFKKGRNAEFMQTEEQLFSQPNVKVDIEPVIKSSEKILSRFDEKSPLRNKLSGFIERLKGTNGDPYQINSLKQEISDATDIGSPLYLGKKQSKLLGDVARDIDKSISESIPGYKDLLNKPYAEKTKMLEKWIEGPVGKVFEKGESSKPSDIFKTIFENTDKRLANELKEVIPSELYGLAADEYLSDLTRMAKETPTKSRNNINQLNKIKDHFIKNRSQLEATLPSDQFNLIDNLAKDIEHTGFGRPSGDYLSKAEQGIIKNSKGVFETATKMGRKAGLDWLERNEMLTGQSIPQQFGEFGNTIGRNLTKAEIGAQNLQNFGPKNDLYPSQPQNMDNVPYQKENMIPEQPKVTFEQFISEPNVNKKESKGISSEQPRVSFEDFINTPKNIKKR